MADQQPASHGPNLYIYDRIYYNIDISALRRGVIIKYLVSSLSEIGYRGYYDAGVGADDVLRRRFRDDDGSPVTTYSRVVGTTARGGRGSGRRCDRATCWSTTCARRPWW